MSKKQTQDTFDADLKAIFGEPYSECVRGNSLDYLVEKGISSGLKSDGFNTERVIVAASPLEADFVIALQSRELLAIIAKNSERQIELLEQIIKLAK